MLNDLNLTELPFFEELKQDSILQSKKLDIHIFLFYSPMQSRVSWTTRRFSSWTRRFGLENGKYPPVNHKCRLFYVRLTLLTMLYWRSNNQTDQKPNS
jgi:hypothetical protein